jgi:hypothetical protein
MRKIYIYSTGRQETSEITFEFAQGVTASNTNWNSIYLDLAKHQKIPADADAIAVLGILRGTGLLIKEAIKRKIDYYYLDHAYFSPGYGGQGWLRITKNAHAMTYLTSSNGIRWKTHFAPHNPISLWTNESEKKKILVLPPTNAIEWFFGAKKWTKKTISLLEKYSSKGTEILVRQKPNEPIVDGMGNLVRLQKNSNTRTLDEDIDQVRLVVAYNSTVAIDALRKGLPVLTSKNSCCYPVSEKIEHFPFNTKKQPYEPKRLKLFEWLSDNQFNRTEIINGSAWESLLCRK